MTPNAYALYIELCAYRHRETGQCTPSKAEQMGETGLSQSGWYAARACLIEQKWARFPVADGGQIDLLVGFEIPDSRKTGNQQLTAFPENGKSITYEQSIPDSRKTGNQQLTAFPIPGKREIPGFRESGMLIGRTENSYLNRETTTPARAREASPPELPVVEPEFSPLEDALRQAKRWPMMPGQREVLEIRQVAARLAEYTGADVATPERVKLLGQFYAARQRGRPNPALGWKLEFVLRDWGEFLDWLSTREEQSRSANGHDNGNRETAAERDERILRERDYESYNEP